MTIHECAQRSDEWYELRKGKFTASDFGDLMPSSRQKPDEWNKTQMGIIYRVAAERMTGEAISGGFVSQAMQHGIDTEEEARFAYELETGAEVRQGGFIELDEWIGCSPDGLVGEDGGLEIKCPNSDTHLRYLYNPADLKEDYYWQCVGAMLCSGREWWDLFSFDSRFNNETKQSIKYRIERSASSIAQLIERLDFAVKKVKEITGGI